MVTVEEDFGTEKLKDDLGTNEKASLIDKTEKVSDSCFSFELLGTGSNWASDYCTGIQLVHQLLLSMAMSKKEPLCQSSDLIQIPR